MQTVDKAMQLLNLFSVSKPEIGLTELSRMAGFDKAATRRFLVALQKHQFIEQNPQTKDYRLGMGFLHLAKVCEASFPVERLIRNELEQLVAATNETAHGSITNRSGLFTLDVQFPPRANRVHVELAEPLPLHATASGLAFLAFAAPHYVENLPPSFPKITSHTLDKREDLLRAMEQVKQQGYARNECGYEEEVIGTAVPVFGRDGQAIATLAIAAPESRVDAALASHIITSLIAATSRLSQALGGQFPPHYQQIISDLKLAV